MTPAPGWRSRTAISSAPLTHSVRRCSAIDRPTTTPTVLTIGAHAIGRFIMSRQRVRSAVVRDDSTPRLPVRTVLLRAPRGRPRPLLQIRRWLRILGPGLVTGAADDDPSGIGTYSQAGAAFGTGQLWLALYMLPFVIAVQEMCGRIGPVTGRGLAGGIRPHYRRKLLFCRCALLFTAHTT